MSTDRFVCVHGHFYQPPRENPWLELIEQQDSAFPFHDWNERINAECYAPNTRARILDDQGRITELSNNYARMSFNVGPTLLAWMEHAAHDTYRAIIEADRTGAERFGGHGPALAQVYNHVIMPLANRRDRRTQVLWGLQDFRERFDREPEGMWLAETAADLDTLDLLAEVGLTFTILSPYQAKRTRPIGGTWTDASGGAVDPSRPYRVKLPSGRSIVVFFYDGPASRAVAFEGLLNSGRRFADRLLAGFVDRDGPQLMHIATDGESYGHHHRHGEMALAHALALLGEDDDVELTIYGAYLEHCEPEHEAEIVSPSSWSCAHGVDRWRADCGCATGDLSEGHQAWRGPLREAFDWLRDELAPRFEDSLRPLLHDPWAARDDYIEVILDRSSTTVAEFLDRHARRVLADVETRRTISLLEMQRQLLLMYTSCGWFFDEVSRIETAQVMHYAARAVQLAEDWLDVPVLDGELRRRLEKAEGNLPELPTARDVYETRVLPAVTSLRQVAAHVAVASLFGRANRTVRLGAYRVDREAWHVAEAGRASLAAGRLTVRSTVTLREADYDVGVLHLGDHNIVCGVQRAGSDADREGTVARLVEAFEKADFPEVVRMLDREFDAPAYSLRDLFRDEQRRILRSLLEGTVAEAEATQRTVYRGRAPLMRFLRDLGVALPAPLQAAAQVTLNSQLRLQFREGDVDPAQIAGLVEEAEDLDVTLDVDALSHALSGAIARLSREITERLQDPALFDRFAESEDAFFDRVANLVEVASSVPFEVDLAPAQHTCYRALRDHHDPLRKRATAGDDDAAAWLHHLRELADTLQVAIPSER